MSYACVVLVVYLGSHNGELPHVLLKPLTALEELQELPYMCHN